MIILARNKMKSLIELIVPEEITRHFEYDNYENYEETSVVYIIHMTEKNDVSHIPKEIVHEGKAVLDGYVNSIDLQTFPLKGKEVFLRLRRRRWKKKGTSTGYSNSYTFNQSGIKATREFGSFLKEIGRI